MMKDDRGRGLYDIFPYIAKGQVNISTTYPGVIRAFHRHKTQWDHWYLVAGNIEVALYDPTLQELHLEYLSEGESVVLDIPPGVWHGFRVLGNTNATLLYYVTERFNAASPDEEREAWDKFYRWRTVNK